MLLAAGQPGGHRIQQVTDAKSVRQSGQLARPERRPPARKPGCPGPRDAGTGPDPGAAVRPAAARAGPQPAGRRPGQRPARQLNQARPWLYQASDGLQQRGLPRPRRAEQRQPLARRHLEGCAHGEVAAVNLDVGVEHAHSRYRRPAAAVARPRAGPGHTAALMAARSPAAWSRSAAAARTDGRQ